MKAVYYISNHQTWGHVSTRVWNILEQESFLSEHTGIIFYGQEVMRYTDGKQEYYFVPMDTAVCLDYPRFLPEMNRYFSDCDMSGMVTWHEGTHAPEHVHDDGATIHNILCVCGVHFDPKFAEAVFAAWGNEAFGVSHIIANQWLVTGKYEGEDGFERMCDCIHSVSGGVEAIFFHDKLKGCYKDLVRRLGQELQIPIYKHQKLRTPQELEWHL